MNKKLVAIIGAIALTIGIFFLSKSFFLSSSQQKISDDKPILVREFNNKQGPSNAKITVVEFFDPECESCKAFYPHLKTILEEYNGKIQFVVRYMLYHKSSLMAAKASQAAARQGQFWEYHHNLFAKQGEWGHKQIPDQAYFLKYAEELGLDINKFKSDMDDQEIANQLAIDVADGSALGVKGTPSIFVNGVILNDLDLSILRKMINENL